ncbi:Plasma membrane t-SNARE, secretory vesicle fusion [Coemansia sp. RSA 2320]|nr:Plasma membrane t-SNARE, secretory vesicle fusion [Coemansia sp. RSA 2320]
MGARANDARHNRHNHSSDYGRPSAGDHATNHTNQKGGRAKDAGYSRHNAGHGNGHDSAATDEEFFGLIDRITYQISQVDQQINDVRGLHEKALTAANESRHKEAALERDDKVAATNDMITEIKQNLKDMANACKRSKYDPSVSKSQAAVRDGRHRALAKKFADQLQRYRQMEYEYSQRNHDRIARQYRIARPNATDEEVRDAIASDQASQVFSQAVMSSNRLGEARRVLRDVEERQADIRKIEKTINELAQMFIEVSEMVNQQQEVIDGIDSAVEGAYTEVSAGRTKVNEAIVLRKSSRKRMWCIIIFLIVILIIVGLVLYFKLRK